MGDALLEYHFLGGATLLMIVICILLAAGPVETGGEFVRGDLTGDELVSAVDVDALWAFLFEGAPLVCWDRADVNADGLLDVTDVVVLSDLVFSGGGPLAPPFPGCGRPLVYHWRCVPFPGYCDG